MTSAARARVAKPAPDWRTGQRIARPVVEALMGAPGLITLASYRALAVIPSVTRAAMPIPATTVAQTSETTTILRWVMRSAVNMEVLFMTLLPGIRGFPGSLVARSRNKVHFL